MLLEMQGCGRSLTWQVPQRMDIGFREYRRGMMQQRNKEVCRESA